MIDAEERFRTLYDAHRLAVFSYFARRFGAESASDLAAEVFTVAWRRIGDVPAGDAALLWLYGAARNVGSHHRRRLSRSTRLRLRVASMAPLAVSDEPDASAIRTDELRRVRQAAARLRESDQEILRLAAWEELPHVQIAQLLDVSVAAVDQRIHRAKKRLATEFQRVMSSQTRSGGGDGS